MKDNADNQNEMIVSIQDTYLGDITKAESVIVVKRNLVQFIHPEGGYKKGEEWAERYYHIMTPETQRCGEMYTYRLEGYSYGIGKPLLVVWVGYLYAEAPSKDHLIYMGASEVVLPRDKPSFNASQYVGSNGHLYLLLGPIKQYFNSFTLSYQSGSTGQKVHHNKNKYKVHVSASGRPK